MDFIEFILELIGMGRKKKTTAVPATKPAPAPSAATYPTSSPPPALSTMPPPPDPVPKPAPDPAPIPAPADDPPPPQTTLPPPAPAPSPSESPTGVWTSNQVPPPPMTLRVDAWGLSDVASGSSWPTAATPAERRPMAPWAAYYNARAFAPDGSAIPPDEIDWLWDYGEPTYATWTAGLFAGHPEASRNIGRNHLGRHLHDFDTAPVTTVRLTATHPVHGTTTWTATVTVDQTASPDIFAGGRTILCGTGDMTCAGVTGATVVESTDLVTIANVAKVVSTVGGGSVRVLFKSGQDFSLADGAKATFYGFGGPFVLSRFSAAGPYTGASKPRWRMPTSSTLAAPYFNFSNTGSSSRNMHDLKIFDIGIEGWRNSVFGSGQLAICVYGHCDDQLFLRLSFDGVAGTCMYIHDDGIRNANFSAGEAYGYDAGHRIYKRVSMVACTQVPRSRGGNSFAYINAEHVWVAGNSMEGTGNDGRGHNIRFLYLKNGLVEHNDIIDAGTGQHAIKIHSQEVRPWALKSPVTVDSDYGPSGSTGRIGLASYVVPIDPHGGPLSWTHDAPPPVWKCVAVTGDARKGLTEPDWRLAIEIGSTIQDNHVTWQRVDWSEVDMVRMGASSSVGGDALASRDNVIACNYINAPCSAWPIACGPHGATSTSLVDGLIVERNLLDCLSNYAVGTEIFSDSGGKPIGTKASIAMVFWGHNILARNNIVVASNTEGFAPFMAGGRAGALTWTARDVRIEQNTVYFPSAAAGVLLVTDDFGSNIACTGSAIYKPSGPYAERSGKPPAGLTIRDNTPAPSTPQGFAGPLGSIPVSGNAARIQASVFALVPGSPAIDAGGSTSARRDLYGAPRVSGAAADRGAIELQQA